MKMRILLFAIPLISGCVAARTQIAEQGTQELSGQLCVLSNPAVTESSGVALSKKSPGVYWTHNDSGDGPNLYAFNSKGEDLGTYTLNGAEAIDWEDMASAVVNGNPQLFVGDVGDNLRTRKTITVYQVSEPNINPGKNEITSFKTFTLKYPDGAHDCETLLITPNGDVQLVTKSQDGVSGVYQAKLSSSQETITLTKLGEVKFEGANPAARVVTAGDMSQDGKRVVIRTYLSAYLFEGTAADWFKKSPKPIPIPFQGQSEAICFDSNESIVITTSEGKPCPVYWTKLP